MMSSTVPQTTNALNGCNQISELPIQQSFELHSLQTSDSEQSISTHSQENDRKTHLFLPMITGPNGSPEVVSVRPEYSESEKSVRSSQKTLHKSSNEWEILEGLKDGQRCENKPLAYDGYMLKRRKWPLKGWHKRYFHLENGILSYSKSPNDMMKGKIHGSVDVGLSVISTKKSSKRIDIDAEEFIYHLKVKNRIMFTKWVSILKHHRLFRQHEIAFGNRINAVSTPVRSALVGSGQSTPNNEINSKVVAWILDSSVEPLNSCSKEFNELQLKLVKLSSLLKLIEMQSDSKSNALPDSETVSLKKQRRRFLLRRKKQNNSTNVTNDKSNKKLNEKSDTIVHNNDVLIDKNHSNLQPLPIGHHLSSSHPALNEPSLQVNNSGENWMTKSCNEAENEFNSHSVGSECLKPTKAVMDFVNLANEVNNSFRGLFRSVQYDNYRKVGLKQCNDDFDLVYSMRQSLSETLKQNKELREKLKQIHETSNITLLSPVISPEGLKITRATSIGEEDIDEQTVIHQPLAQSVSRDSTSVLSISEYFDAEENLSADTTSTEDEDEESVVTDISDDGTEYRTSKKSLENVSIVGNTTGRRSQLPAQQPDSGDVSLWSLLCKNIGKDLSKISMPVTINEPLNVLQRLCEELEYSELLDKAANIEDNRQRMLFIAAFAVSSYSSAYYRAGHKPFNPLLCETYECIREDKGFRFISEQVSHHPPISACFAQSDNFVFSQDMRIKTKFWGKSMEIIPFGTVHLLLPAFNAHYRYNKVTTCVHNLFKGQRWVDAYGELTITDGELTCKLTFEKASYWSNKKHEVNGVLLNSKGDIIERLFGKWNEALHYGSSQNAKCIWRPGAMPEGYDKYYGFSRFAIELNELTPDLRKELPPTDTRFRPDQRLLEEGNISSAETVKLQLEQQQRERRKQCEQNGQPEPSPLWFRKEVKNNGEESYKYGEKYWQTRDEGFQGIQFEKLW